MPKDFDSCVIQVHKQLMKDNPNMMDDKAKSKAFAVCTASFKKIGKLAREFISESKKLDEEGNIIVGENVKVILDSSNFIITE